MRGIMFPTLCARRRWLMASGVYFQKVCPYLWFGWR